MSTRPAHDEAERHVLGSLMHNRRAIDDVAAILEPADFHAPKHEVIYAAILAMHARGDAVDPVTLAATLVQAGTIDAAGGHVYLADLYAAPPTTANVGYYARIVADQAVRRRLHAAGTRIVQLAASGEGDVAALAEMARGEIDATRRATASTSWVADTIDAAIDSLEKPAAYHPTPWAALNELVLGWRPGAFYVIAARPGVGKSIAGLDAAIGLAQRGPVAVSSIEMPRDEWLFRLLANRAGVPVGRLDRRDLTAADWEKIARHRAEVAALPISIDDRPGATIVDVTSHARTVARRGPIGAVIVDYLQLLSAPRGEKRPRHEVVGDFSRQLKILAKELDCPVIALAQLNRKSADRADNRPQMSDLRESGSIEQDADVVMLLHENPNDETDLDGLVEKNRHGPRGPIKFVRRGWYARLDDPQWSPHAVAERTAS